MSYPAIIKLFTGQAADGTSEEFALPVDFSGGFSYHSVYIFGTFGGGQVTLQASPDGTNWVNIPDSPSSAANIVNLHIRMQKIRAVLSGSTGASINTWIV